MSKPHTTLHSTATELNKCGVARCPQPGLRGDTPGKRSMRNRSCRRCSRFHFQRISRFRMIGAISALAMAASVICTASISFAQGAKAPRDGLGTAKAQEYKLLADPNEVGLSIKIGVTSERTDSTGNIISWGRQWFNRPLANELELTTHEIERDAKGDWVVTKDYGRIKIKRVTQGLLVLVDPPRRTGYEIAWPQKQRGRIRIRGSLMLPLWGICTVSMSLSPKAQT